MRFSLFRGYVRQQLFERRPVPGVACKGPAQLVGDAKTFAVHKNSGWQQDVGQPRTDSEISFWLYAVTYLPASTIRLAICWVKAIRLNGSYLNSRRRITSWGRSVSPSATAATTLRDADSILSMG